MVLATRDSWQKRSRSRAAPKATGSAPGSMISCVWIIMPFLSLRYEDYDSESNHAFCACLRCLGWDQVEAADGQNRTANVWNSASSSRRGPPRENSTRGKMRGGMRGKWGKCGDRGDCPHIS